MQDLKKWNRIVIRPRGLPFSGVGGGGGGAFVWYDMYMHVSFNQVCSEFVSCSN